MNARVETLPVLRRKNECLRRKSYVELLFELCASGTQAELRLSV